MGDKYVLVTGSSTGIGEACALHLDELGWGVFAGVRRQEDGERLRAKASGRLRPIQLDVTDTDQVKAAFATIDEVAGPKGLTGLVNNAGIARGGPVEVLALDEWRDQFEVNLIGQVAVTKAAIPALRRATGRVVFISSISGRSAPGFLGPYAASKHALEALASSFREEMLPWGLRVAVVEPGVVDTPIWSKAPTEEEFVAMHGREAFERYRWQFEAMAENVEKLVARATPVTKVAQAVAHALTAPKPRYRYLVGWDAQLIGAFGRVLPDRVFARIRRRL